jgi:carboxyl-terminal processing protease
MLGLTLVACAPTPQISDNNPGEQLYYQATQFLIDNYFGYSKLNLNNEITKGREEINKRCQDTSCNLDLGRRAIVKLITQLNDEHTFYQDDKTYAETQRERNGEGSNSPQLGVRWVYRETSKGWLVLETGLDYPATSAGLTRGDLVVGVNGQPLPGDKNSSADALARVIRRGQNFTVTIRRAGQTRTLQATTRVVDYPWSPTLKYSDDVAVLRVPDFDSQYVANETHKLIARAAKSKLKAIVIDLRGDLGGALTQCAAVTGAFLGSFEARFASKTGAFIYNYDASGSISRTDARGNRSNLGEVNSPGVFKGNVVVMVNKNSARCAEVMTAHLQLRKRAVVIGEPTFGILNSGYRVFNLMDGGALNITVLRTLDPNGNPFPERIKPNMLEKDDLETLEKTGRDTLLERAMRLARGPDTTLEPSPSARR